jgi:hypothetical protein
MRNDTATNYTDVSRGGGFMLTVLGPANSLRNENKKSSVLLSWLSGSLLHTLKYRRTDQIKCIVSQLQPASRALLAPLRSPRA